MRKARARGGYAVPIVIILAIFAMLVYMAVSKGSNFIPANNSKFYDEVMSLDFSVNYPPSPDDVLEKYCDIDRFLSGNTIDKFTTSDLESLVETQRQLLHSELLEINPIDAHVKGYADKIDYLKDREMRLMQVDLETPRFSEDAKECSVGVKQYWSQNMEVDMVYNLKKDEGSGNWKIVGWYVNEQKGA